MRNLIAGLVIVTLLFFAETGYSVDLNKDEMAQAAGNYSKYCELCHGAGREGHANDHAPSLRSESLMKSGFPHTIYLTVSYGRLGTPMAGFVDEVGGPMSKDEIIQLLYWIRQKSGVLDHVDLIPTQLAVMWCWVQSCMRMNVHNAMAQKERVLPARPLVTLPCCH